MSTNTAGRAKRQKTDDDSFTAAEDDRKNASSPTGKDISLALCRIVDTDKYTTDEINKALDDLCVWGYSNNNTDERARISKEFMELGGIPRILNFIQGNKNNIGFMLRASRVTYVLYPGPNDEHLEHASTMAQKFVEREGVELMLSIIKEQYTGELDIDQLNTLDHIFSIFSNTMWNMNKKNMVDIDKFFPIIDAGISTLAVLGNINTLDTADANNVKEEIFNFLYHFVHYNAEMIDVNDFQEKNIFLKCVGGLKDPVDNSWKYDKKAWGGASKFFYVCCSMNRKILSRESDFEVIVPFCVQFMKVDPNHASASSAFGLLRKASNIIGKKKMMTSHKGLLLVLGTVADCGNAAVSNDVKEEAMYLSKYLFDGL